MKRHVSISLRLTMWFDVMFFLGWVLFGAAMWLNLSRTLRLERHQTLARRVDRLQELLIKNESEDEASRHQDFSDFAHATGNGLVEIFYPNGTRAYPSPSKAAAAFPAFYSCGRTGAVSSRSVGRTALLGAGAILRSRWEDGCLTGCGTRGGNLLVLQSFWKGLLASVPILLLLSSAGGYWVSRKALEPVDRITASARSISIRNLSEKLPVRNTGDELQRLAKTCNAMRERLESAVNQIKDLQQMLCTSFADLCPSHAQWQRSHSGTAPWTVRAVMHLKISLKRHPRLRFCWRRCLHWRAQTPELSKVSWSGSIASVVEEACEMARPLANAPGLYLRVFYSSEHSTKVLGDFTSLRRLLWVLLDNALKYTEPPGHIEVTLSSTARQPTLVIRDSGIGISQLIYRTFSIASTAPIHREVRSRAPG